MNSNLKGDGMIKTCEHCKKEVSMTPSRAKVFRFCSIDCMKAATKPRKPPCTCLACGAKFIQEAASKGKYCSRICANAGRKGMSRQEYLEHIGKQEERLEVSTGPKLKDGKRKCHDCGKPCTDYRCRDCWQKRGRTYFYGENDCE